MRNFRITLRGALLTISAIAVWMAVFQKRQAIAKLDAKIQFAEAIHIMRWDMPDWWSGQTTFAIWIDDEKVISKKIPLTAPSNGLWDLRYSVQDRASIRVKGSFSFVPNGEPQFSKVSEFMEFWLAPVEE